MTLTQAKQQEQKAQAGHDAAVAEVDAAKQALAAAQDALNQLVGQPLPKDGEQADAAREKVDAAERAVIQGKSRNAHAGFAERRAEVALTEAREQVEVLAPHAATLEKLARACTVIAEKDAAAVALVARFESDLRRSLEQKDEAVAEAAGVFGQLPVAARRHVDYPASAAPVFGSLDHRDSGLLRFVARIPESVLVAPQQQAAPPWKKVGAR